MISPSDQETLKDVNFTYDRNIVLFVTPKSRPAKPVNAFTMLGLPNFGPGGLFSSAPSDSSDDEENPRQHNYADPYNKINNGKLEDPRKWSVARNSSTIFKLQLMTSRDYNAKDGNKIRDYLAAVRTDLLSVFTRP